MTTQVLSSLSVGPVTVTGASLTRLPHRLPHHLALVPLALALLWAGCPDDSNGTTPDVAADVQTDVQTDGATDTDALPPIDVSDSGQDADIVPDVMIGIDSDNDVDSETDADAGSETDTPSEPTLTVRGAFTIPQGVVIPPGTEGLLELAAVDESSDIIEVVASAPLAPLELGAAIPFNMEIPLTPDPAHLISIGSQPDLIEANYLLIASVDGAPMGASFPNYLVYLDGTLPDYYTDFGATAGWSLHNPTLEFEPTAYEPYDPVAGIVFPANVLLVDRPPLSVTIAPDLTTLPDVSNLVVAVQFSPFEEQPLPPEPTVAALAFTPTGPGQVLELPFADPPADHGNLYKGRTIQRYEVMVFSDTDGDLVLDEGEPLHATSKTYAYYFGVVTWQAAFSIDGSTFSAGWSLLDLGTGTVSWDSGVTLTP